MATIATNPPSEFLCPITYEVMTDPVIGSDGHTYERAAITAWLQTRGISPMTNRRMTIADLQPNFTIKSLIETMMKSGGPTVAAAAPATKSSILKEFTITATPTDDKVCLEVKVPSETPMESVTIAVLDMSGSMGESSSKTFAEGGYQFSRRDLVQHSTRTLAHLLAKRYTAAATRLGILTFSNTAEVKMPVVEMDASGLGRANTVIDALQPGGGTNIWDGLRQGIAQVEAAHNRWPNANIHLVLLTDGEPTPDYVPLRGIAETLRQKLAVTGVKFTLSSFGFGTRLNTDLLDSISSIGNGTYGYIPDCSMAGTVFINYAASVLSTVASNVSLRVGGETIALGSLQAGQAKTALVLKKAYDETGGAVEISYDHGHVVTLKATAATATDTDALLRANLIQAVRTVLPYSTSPLKAIQSWIAAQGTPTPFAKSVLADIESPDENKGQLMKAVSRNDWFESWGKNHLISYARALVLQQCVNFKDAALQHFGGTAFHAIVDEGNDIFADLPVPKPSIVSYNTTAATLGTINMNNYNTAQGGCWAGYDKVLMADGSWAYTNQIKAGDYVAGGHRVLCIVRTQQFAPVNMVKLPFGPTITPWHPVQEKDMNEWVFPANIRISLSILNLHYVYNLVLESGHTVQIGDWKVCTLGHGFEDNDVIRHEFFGTFKVISVLMHKPGWGEGMITLNSNPLRDNDTGMVKWL